MKQDKPIYTVKEMAQAVGYKNPARVRAMIIEGKIKAEKVGRDWFISPKEVERIKKWRDSRLTKKVR